MKVGTNISWEEWKKALGVMVRTVEGVGVSEQRVDDIAYRIGNFLADKIDPNNAEQRVVRELWEVGTDEDKKVLSRLIVNLVNGKQPDNLH